MGTGVLFSRILHANSAANSDDSPAPPNRAHLSPPLLYEVDRYSVRALARLHVTPGINGLWQVKGRGRVSFDEMVEMDLEYIAASSFWGDIAPIVQTLPTVLSGRGAG